MSTLFSEHFRLAREARIKCKLKNTYRYSIANKFSRYKSSYRNEPISGVIANNMLFNISRVNRCIFSYIKQS